MEIKAYIGLTTIKSDNIVQTLEILASNNVDIFLSEINPRDNSVFELVNKIRSGVFPEIRKDMAIIGFLKSSNPSLIEKSAQTGISSIIVWPIETQSLISVFEKHLSKFSC